MGTLKVYLDDEIIKKIREEAARRFGSTRGSLNMAAHEAFVKWLKAKPKKEIVSFEKTLGKVAGSWKVEEGKRYIRKLRNEWKKREKRLSL